MKTTTTVRTVAVTLTLLAWPVPDRADCTPDTQPPSGRITGPESGTCVGAGSFPLLIEDDFADGCDPEPTRSYDPAPLAEIGILAPGADAGDRLGRSIALDGDVIVAGAPGFAGSAAVFRRGVDGWAHEAWLRSPEPLPDEDFGAAVAVRGDTIVIGTPLDGGFREEWGAAYVFRHGVGGWTLEQRLSPQVHRGRFGSSVAIDEDTIVAGHENDRRFAGNGGSVGVYVRQDGGWQPQALLVPRDLADGDFFGASVAIDGDVLVAGAHQLFRRGPGAAWVFRRYGSVWVEEQMLRASDGERDDRFGHAVAIDEDTIVVGNPRDENEDGRSSGAAYVFHHDGVAWTETAKLTTPDRPDFDGFGARVSLEGDSLIVTGGGAAFTYLRDGDAWVPDRRLTVQAGLPVESIAQDGPNLAVGVETYGTPGDSIFLLSEGPPSGPPSYDRHGDRAVTLTVTDRAGNAATDATAFTIDLLPPRVEFIFESEGPRLIEDLPFALAFTSHDRDLATGGVVREQLLLQGCLVYDGRTYGNADGLLRDEMLILTSAEMCRIFRSCGFEVLDDPEFVVQAIDCGGNAGSDRLPIHVGPLTDVDGVCE